MTSDEDFWEAFPIIANNTDILGFSNYGSSEQAELWKQLASYLFFLFAAIVLETFYKDISQNVHL